MKCWIVAEAGVNWNGDRAKIVALIEAAKAAGASHVKFQAFNADFLIARRGITDQNTIELLRRNELTDADLDMIQREAGRVGIPHFYSVFDPSQIERVLSRGACALKIGHAEAGYEELEFACHEHSKRVPIYQSNPRHEGHVGGNHGCNVWCINEYPATGHPCLHMVERKRTKRPRYLGFSSHYTDYRIPAAAAMRGAEYIEAHLMLGERDNYQLTEPEAAWSLSPINFGKMVKLIREHEGWL